MIALLHLALLTRALVSARTHKPRANGLAPRRGGLARVAGLTPRPIRGGATAWEASLNSVKLSDERVAELEALNAKEHAAECAKVEAARKSTSAPRKGANTRPFGWICRS